MIKGKCLCEEVKFNIHCEKLKYYSCHCSLCRKTTGTLSNVATMIDSHLFEFESGTDNIKLFTKPTGFQSSFCTTCGSALPKQLRNTDMY